MKKFVACLLFFAILLLPVVSVNAEETHEVGVYEYEYIDVEIIFSENTRFNEDQRQRIADILANGVAPVETRAWCWLTGHKYVSDGVTVITHKDRTYSPRCLQQFYEITTCENCNYYAEELLASQHIVCCPEE